jgi:hypothetical protein
MLIEYRPFYRFSFFLFQGVIGTPDWVNRLSPGFGVLEMMPSLISHPNIYLGLGEQPANMQQLRFITSQKDMTVIFDTDRCIFEMQIIPMRKLPPAEDFIAKAEEIVKIITNVVEGKANRIGFTTTGICKKMDMKKLNEIHKKLFMLPEDFSSNQVVEWNSRHIYRTSKDINEKNELLNVILDLNRIQITHYFEHKPVPFDGIEIGFDINTYQGNSSQRFSINDVRPFLSESFNIENTIETSLQKIIGEDKT